MRVRRVAARSILAVALATGLVFSGCNKKEEPTGSGNAASKTPPTPAAPSAPAANPQAPGPRAPDMTVSGVDFAKAYKADEKAADAKYKGKYLEVSGLVSKIGSAIPDLEWSDKQGNRINVAAAADNDKVYALAPEMRCFIVPADSARAYLLTPGQKVTIRGTCEGKPQGGSAVADFRGCSIVQVGPDPAPSVTAETIAQAYAKDPKAASRDYSMASNFVIVKGTIQKADADSHQVWLDAGKGADGKPLSVHCRVLPAVWPEVEKHPVGQSITIKGSINEFKENSYLELMSALVMP